MGAEILDQALHLRVGVAFLGGRVYFSVSHKGTLEAGGALWWQGPLICILDLLYILCTVFVCWFNCKSK